jgi:hypothetical protein
MHSLLDEGFIMQKAGVTSFHHQGVFIGVSRTSTDLERSVWQHVVAGRQVGVASTDFLHQVRLLLMKTRGNQGSG